MLDVLTSIEKRREITAYVDQPIPKETLDQLIRSLYLAPSGNNVPSREYVVVQDREMLQKLSTSSPYMKWLAQASVGVVITGRPDVSKYWLQDASIAGAFLWLAATSLGLGAAWGAVHHSEDPEETKRREDYTRGLLNIPESVRVVAIIGVGYPAIDPPPKAMYPLEQVLSWEKYGQNAQSGN